MIALSGANFYAELNGRPVPVNQSITVSAGTELKFTKVRKGVFCYLAIQGGFRLSPWLNSNSTNQKAQAGGWNGISLQKGDVIEFKSDLSMIHEIKIFPWRANVFDFYNDAETIQVLRGPEFDWLNSPSQEKVMKEFFTMTPLRDRMGYRLKGEVLSKRHGELISTSATFGSVQLLPDGQLIILMADHQTTGGYPRVAQVIAADRSKLVQTNVGAKVSFREISLQEAEDLLLLQRKVLKQIQVTCTVHLKNF